MQVEDLLKIARLPGANGKISVDLAFAYYTRPWGGSPCSVDDIIAQAVIHDIDPGLLMKMCWESGELPPEEA